MFTVPPFLREGRVYVPAGQFCAWLGAGLAWRTHEGVLQAHWRGRTVVFSRSNRDVVIHKGLPFLRLRTFAQAYDIRLTWWQNRNVVDFGDPLTPLYAAIPVGWKEPVLPSGLGPAQKEIWRLLTTPKTKREKWKVQPRNIRVVGRWAAAEIHPLNFVTDDALVLLERRKGSWEVITSGTDLGGRNWGIPAKVRRQLGLRF